MTNTLHTFSFDGSWNQIKGQLRQKYALLTDDDLEFVEGKGEELLGRLQSKLGLTEEALIELLTHLQAEATDVGARVRGKVREAKAHVEEIAGDVKAKVTEAAGEAYEYARERTRTMQGEAGEYVSQKPRQALLTALAVGFVAGLLIRR